MSVKTQTFVGASRRQLHLIETQILVPVDGREQHRPDRNETSSSGSISILKCSGNCGFMQFDREREMTLSSARAGHSNQAISCK